MKHSLALLALLALPYYLHLQAGSLTGTIQARGKTENSESAGKYDSRKFKFIERVNYEALRDFVVYVEGTSLANTSTNETPSPPLDPSTFVPIPAKIFTKKLVAQKGAVFSPHINPIIRGASIEWPNEDEIFHNVFSISEAKEFDLGLYKKPDIKKVVFDKLGRVDVFCSIHSTMNCVVLVLPNKYFSVTDSKGRYLIPDLAPGKYEIRVWHERLPSLRRTVTIIDSKETNINFVLGPGGMTKIGSEL